METPLSLAVYHSFLKHPWVDLFENTVQNFSSSRWWLTPLRTRSTKKMIPSRTYAGREFLSMLEGMIELNKFLVDDQAIKMTKLKGITEMIINLDEVNNTNNLEDGKPSNSLLTYHMTSNEDFMSFEPQNPQYKKLENGEFTSLTLRITDQNNDIITDGPQVTVVLHIRDSGKL